MSNQNQVQFTPVKTGDMSEIPPDLAAGEWQGVCSVKTALTSKDKYPMLILNWKAVEALTDGNEDFVGKSVADFLTFFPENHAGSKMSKMKMKSICERYGISIPAITTLESWDDLAPFIKELQGLKGKFWTWLQQNKETGEMRTQVSYSPPRGGLRAAASEEEEDDAPKNKKIAASKKTRRN